jgi:hypothetical protein
MTNEKKEIEKRIVGAAKAILKKGDLRETTSIRNIQLNIDTSDYMELKVQAKEMEKEQIIQAYSNAWHDGQDAIIMTIEHIDKGGDERGLKYYEQL